MKVIVGLGNPGDKYKNTRHNLGFMALDALLEKLERVDKTFWEEKRDFKAQIKKIKISNHEQRTTNNELLLVKPTTFMNDSGIAVSKVINYYKVDTADLIVIHDDVDLPYGKIRVRFGGSAGGHHGVESIIEHLGTDKFLRVRLGIGNDGRNEMRTMRKLDEYVLGNIASNERGKTKTMIRETVRTIELILKHGTEKYMAKYNR